MVGSDEALEFWSACTLMLSTYGNLEMVGIAHPPNIESGVVSHYFRNPFGWQGPTALPARVASLDRYLSVAHLQRRAGDPPTFEALIAIRAFPGKPAGIVHLSRSEDVRSWRRVDQFGTALTFEGVAAIDSNYGNLEVLACAGGRLYFLWQGDRGWSDAHPIGVGSGRPGFTQSSFGRIGNFEAVVPAPAESDGLLFYWRNNDVSAMPWSQPFTIPGSTGRGGYEDVTLIQGSYDGHLEVLARRRRSAIVDFYWRDRDPSWAWHGPGPMR